MTAVEKLELRLLGIVSFDSEELRARYKEAIKQAKEMEKEQKGYSEEEVEDIAKDAYAMGRKGILIGVFNKWFEQFKNK